MMDGAGFTGNSRAVRRETAACLLTFIAWTFLWYQAGYYAGKCDAQKMSIENNGGETMIFLMEIINLTQKIMAMREAQGYCFSIRITPMLNGV